MGWAVVAVHTGGMGEARGVVGDGLAARGLWFGYRRGRPVLADVSAAFPAGAVTVVMGANGSGKTTLARLLAGVAAPTRGEVTLDGVPMGRMGPAERARRVALVPQRPGVAFAFTARRVVAAGAHARGLAVSDERVERAMAAVGVEGLAERVFAELSVGQQQMVAIARALVQVAAEGEGGLNGWLIADEPLAPLDPAHAARVMAVLRTLAGRGLGVVVVVHEAMSARAMADRAVLLGPVAMEGGEGAAGSGVIASGVAGEVLTPGLFERAFGVGFVGVAGVRGEAPVPGHLVRG